MTNHANRQIVSTIADNIRVARQECGLTQRELAAALNVDSMYVSRWERAVVTPAYTNLVRVAEALDRPVEWFFVNRSEAAA